MSLRACRRLPPFIGPAGQSPSGGCVKILFCSAFFKPSIGGVEHVGALLAEQFQRAGHEVVVVTQTEAVAPDAEIFTVVRRPGRQQLTRLVADADVVVHNQISLRLAYPLMWLNRPWVVVHHNWLWQPGASRSLGWFKARVLRRAAHIAVSQPLAQALAPAVVADVICNPYADDVFKPMPGVQRQHDLVFVGRLVSDKGVSLLLQALALLRTQGLTPGLCIVGQGPEESALRQQAHALGVADKVRFAGPLQGAALALLLNAHRVAVVPSVWEEPFGIVALESMACGCVPLVARSGGLPAAVGRAGHLFDKCDAADLARGISTLLSDAALCRAYQAAAPAHLARHRSRRIAQRHLQVIERVRQAHPHTRHLADI